MDSLGLFSEKARPNLLFTQKSDLHLENWTDHAHILLNPCLQNGFIHLLKQWAFLELLCHRVQLYPPFLLRVYS